MSNDSDVDAVGAIGSTKDKKKSGEASAAANAQAPQTAQPHQIQTQEQHSKIDTTDKVHLSGEE